MRNPTRILYAALLSHIAQLNGVASAEQKFSVDPSVQQTLETRMQESSEFLSRINVIGVTDQTGAKLGLGIGSPIASTTNTAGGTARTTKDPSSLDENGYTCTQTNSDTHIPYAKLDAWAKFPDFQTRVRDAIIKRQALDRIMVGFNGTSRAATSDATANPLLQDVNKGWLQHLREQAPARWMKEGVAASGVIKIGGATPDYENLDALVMDAVANLIDPWHRGDTQLVAIVGTGLLHDKYFPLVNVANNPATEQNAADLIISAKRIGGLPAVQAPFMKAGAILITRIDNLSLYWQEGSRRRAVTDNPKLDRIENWESSNEAYVIEDLGAACLLENISIEAPAP